MKKNKLNFGLIFCFVLLALGVASSLRGKFNPAQTISQTVAATKGMAAPVIDVVKKPDTAKAATLVGKHIRVPVLMYHHVGPLINTNATTLDLTVSTTDFEAQVVYFKNMGYQSVTLAQVYDALENGGALPAKPIVFTFDDGFKDVFTNAIPILQKYSYTGSFAIATELLGRPTYAVWNDVIAAHRAGMEILSHTENHLDLTSSVYADYDLHREIYGSKQILEQKLGAPVEIFVYPYGKYSDKVISMVKDVGYKMAFTTAYGQYIYENNLLSEPRVRVHGQNGLEKLKLIFQPAPVPAPHTGPVPTNP